jgi:hypothetical protein
MSAETVYKWIEANLVPTQRINSSPMMNL